MTIEENKKIVFRFNKEFLEKGNAEVLKEIVADDFINQTAASSVSNNVDGLIRFVAMLHKGFSNFDIEIHEQVGENDLVATHTGVITGHQPTNKRVAFNVMDFVRLREGKYIEHWGENDILQVIQGL